MRTPATVGILALAAVVTAAALAGAHARNYQQASLTVPADVPLFGNSIGFVDCVDDQFTLFGAGGVVGNTLKTVGATIDPIAPDPAGTCYRPGHILPNANGDVTFSGVDQVQTNVGICISQDHDDDGTLCDDLVGDIQVHACNSGTVNVGQLDLAGTPVWRFQNQPGFPARLTWVTAEDLTAGNSLVPWNLGTCGPGVDAFATTGSMNHG